MDKKIERYYYLNNDPRILKYSKEIENLIKIALSSENQIKDIDYLIRCCFRDYDRLSNEFMRVVSGFTQGKKMNPQLAKILKENKKRIKAEIPLTIFNFEMAYAFDLFCFNIIRCVNFIIDLKARLKDNYAKEFAFDVRKFYRKKKEDVTDEFDKFFIEEYDSWIEDFLNKRGELTHRRISKSLVSKWIFEIRALDNEVVNEEHKMIISMPNLDIDNLEVFYKDKFVNFKRFLLKAIQILNKKKK